MPDSVLRRAALLQHLSTEEREVLYAACTRTTVPKEHAFFDANQNDTFYLIYRGIVIVSLPGTDADTELAQLGPGSTFGEMSFLTGAPGLAQVTAGSEVEVLTVRRATLDALFEEHPRIASRFWRNLCLQFSQRLSATNQLVEYYADLHDVVSEQAAYEGMHGGT